MNRFYQSIILLAGICISLPVEAKKQKNKAPCWTTAPCEPYLETEYLIGIGSGSSIEEADAAAIGSIARQFVVNVSQTQTSIKDLSQTNRADETISQLDHQRLRTETAVQTNTSLQNVKIVEHWERPANKNESGTVYALATIQRSDWLNQIDMARNEISTAQAKIRMELRKADTLYDQIPHYKALIPLVEQDVALYNQRQIIDINKGSMPPALTPQQLASEFQQRRRSSSIFVASDTPYRSSLTNVFGSLDIPITDTTSPIKIMCTADQALQEPDGYGFIKASTTLFCTVYNKDSLLYEQSFTGQASSRDLEKAKLQSEQALTTALTPLVQTLDALWSL
jgi:hypothetical protein